MDEAEDLLRYGCIGDYCERGVHFEGFSELNILQDLEAEGYEVANSNKSTPISIRSPSPTANLSAHPFFREEFSLPFEESFERLISQRRMRATASIPSSSPGPSPARPTKARGGKKRGKTKFSMAGLVAGDSDSSALTQESGDEIAGTPRGSVVTGTDAGTDYADEDDVEMREPSPGTCELQIFHNLTTFDWSA